MHRPLIELIEVVGRIEETIPVEAEPLHVLHDRVDVLGLFLRRIRIVEAQIGPATKLVCQSKVQADRFGMADVQISVRLGRETRLHPSAVFVGLEVFENDVAYEVGRGSFRRRRRFCPSFGRGIRWIHAQLSFYN